MYILCLGKKSETNLVEFTLTLLSVCPIITKFDSLETHLLSTNVIKPAHFQSLASYFTLMRSLAAN